jgi:BASS family bile acid:Na+ symporter
MTDSAIFSLFLPIALAIVMIGLGLHLQMADFRRVLLTPKAVLIALATQMLLLPPVAFGLAIGLGLPPELGMGLVLLAASPGGVTANLFSHLARGDVALNVSLTALNSFLCLLTLPFWVWLGLSLLIGSDGSVPPPTRKIIEVGVLVITPVLIGMGLRHWRPQLADRLEGPVKILSTLVLAGLIVAATVQQWDILRSYVGVVGLAVLIFNLVSLGVGYGISRLARLGVPHDTAIAFEIGIHNGTLAIYVALQVLEMAPASVAPAIYSLLMYVTASLFVGWLLRRAPVTSTAEAGPRASA